MTRTLWRIQLPGRRPFAMVGEPCTHEEAVHAARLIWRNAKVIE